MIKFEYRGTVGLSVCFFPTPFGSSHEWIKI